MPSNTLSPHANEAPSLAAFERLYDEFADRMFSYATRLLRSPDDAADATQNAFMNLFRRLDAIPACEPARSAYVFSVARNASFDLMRRRKRTVYIDDLESDHRQLDNVFRLAGSDSQPEQRALAGSEREILVAALRKLPVRHRRALVLREVGDLSYDEIAADLGINRNAVAQLISRARAGLQRQMAASGMTQDLAPCA